MHEMSTQVVTLETWMEETGMGTHNWYKMSGAILSYNQIMWRNEILAKFNKDMASQRSLVGDVREQPNHMAGAHGSFIIVFLLSFIRPL